MAWRSVFDSVREGTPFGASEVAEKSTCSGCGFATDHPTGGGFGAVDDVLADEFRWVVVEVLGLFNAYLGCGQRVGGQFVGLLDCAEADLFPGFGHTRCARTGLPGKDFGLLYLTVNSFGR